MRIIVAGGRDFNDRELLFTTLDKAFGAVLSKITVISGHARGADSLGEEWAKARGVPVELFIPDWDGLGKKAGIVRNHQMGDTATHLCAFHDGSSRGTADMIAYALGKSLWVKVVRYVPNNSNSSSSHTINPGFWPGPNSASAISCNHANECPVDCRCDKTCYCYVYGSCGKSNHRKVSAR